LRFRERFCRLVCLPLIGIPIALQEPA
jgi:hypothetical protein